ncbi:MAG TPA: metal ABC transporter ATP-binding protein [Patescibacteria group bacterium]|nr:metal ABC transporter ATP-binding protein [Patescibacteria group bacterium]
MCEVCLKQVSFAYHGMPVLDTINLDISAGCFVVVVGPNGAGKSTLLRMIAGLLQPQTGQIVIDGAAPEKAQQQGMIGYVPQHYGRNTQGFPATAEDVVALGLVAGGRGRSLSRQGSRHIVDHMLELVGAERFRHRRIGELSGGEQQRVMVARALASNPQLLLLDEPTSGIDYAASAKIYELLGQLNRTLGITVIMVSHDIDNATRTASHVACIDRGLCYFGGNNEFRSQHLQNPHLWYYSTVAGQGGNSDGD